MRADPLTAEARTLVQRLDELGAITDEPGKLTRTFLSPAMRRANALVGKWLGEAGLSVREDSVGNVIGRLEGNARRAQTLLLGSHLDTVHDAGRFDGPLGVLLPIAALVKLRRQGVTLPYAVEVLGFSEEEGVRFSSAYLGSKGYSGQLGPADLELCDVQGTSVRQALETLGSRLVTLPKAAHARREVLGYVEVHLEQGPVLEARELAVGVVSAIAGQTRARLAFRGKAGHAGTTPMALRRDALAGAAEFTLVAEQLARSRSSLVATVGTLMVSPGAPNVIPGEATFSLDLRHPRDAVRKAALKRLQAAGRTIAAKRGLGFSWDPKQDNGAITCDRALTAQLARSVKAIQGESPALVSGAGHDAVVMVALAPVAMLFVRCRDGLSHHPDEFVAPADLEVALRVMVDFLKRIAVVR